MIDTEERLFEYRQTNPRDLGNLSYVIGLLDSVVTSAAEAIANKGGTIAVASICGAAADDFLGDGKSIPLAGWNEPEVIDEFLRDALGYSGETAFDVVGFAVWSMVEESLAAETEDDVTAIVEKYARLFVGYKE